MKLAVLLTLRLAALVSAGELVTSIFFGPWEVNRCDKVASIVGNNGVETTYSLTCADSSQTRFCEVNGLTVIAGGSQTTILEQFSTTDMPDMNGLSQTAVCALDDTTSASCIVSARQEVPSFYGVITMGFREPEISLVPVTMTAGAISQPSDTVVTMSGSSPSHPTSHLASATSSGSASRVSSAAPSVSGDQGSMSIMTTKGHTSSAPSSSSTRSTGGAPIATGEGALMAGGAAMALLAVL
ncbi:hypothetical protein BO78DRAFT_434494 [Aspergillus sclerotiicarbonarius CBS 121057]|uniref:GPI anchored cell wall protein n=1 Tax=Aspergillus sclerotiicarbonarius (strain CBS 121057 / IBT 28362) TaxID=1448318 RepID=A0A319F5A7_ASPSB|nr:hypothetical protein BO78DRAFT_434494 [Aspergillus sclerotiicarbonarius CBS 121057]